MVKVYTEEHTFSTAWSRILNVWWYKYPSMHTWNVNEIDVIDRRMDPFGSLITRRLVSMSAEIPHWLSSLGVSSNCYILEESVVNPMAQTAVIKSVNICASHWISVQVMSSYKAYSHCDPEIDQTFYEKTVRISSISKAIESYIHTRMGHDFNIRAMKLLCRQRMEYLEILKWRLQMIKLITD